jgi:hypothetical protein
VKPVGLDHPLPPNASGAYTYVGAWSETREDFERLVEEAAPTRGLEIVEFDWACPEERLEAEGRSTSDSEQWALALLNGPVVWDETLYCWTD